MPAMSLERTAWEFMNSLRAGGAKVRSVKEREFTPDQVEGGVITTLDKIHLRVITTLILGGILWVVCGSTLSFLTLWGYVAEKDEKGEWVPCDILSYTDLTLTRTPSREELIRLIQTEKEFKRFVFAKHRTHAAARGRVVVEMAIYAP